jgi:hypothetical protein
MLMRMMMNIVAVSEHIDPALARKVEGWIELLRPVRS